MASEASVALISSGSALLGVVVGGLLQWPLEHVREQGRHRGWLLEKRRDAYVSFLDSARAAYEVIVDWPRAHPGVVRIDDYELQANAVEEAVNRVRFAEGVVTMVGPPATAALARKVHARLRLDRWYYSSVDVRDIRDRMSLLLDEIDDDWLSRSVGGVLAVPEPSRAELGTALGVRRLNDLWSEFEKAAQEIIRSGGKDSNRGRTRGS